MTEFSIEGREIFNIEASRHIENQLNVEKNRWTRNFSTMNILWFT